MDIEKLKQFVALAETLHFGRAAELSNVSPSTLSRAVAQIEEQLRATLFIRDNRSVTITTEGEALLRFARETLQHWETLRDCLQQQSGHLTGELSLYCSVTASYSFLFDILSDFRIRQPLIELKLHTGDPASAVSRVMAGHEDIAIAAKLERMPSAVHFKTITYSPLVLIQPDTPDWNERYASEGKIEWEALPLILSEQGVARERLDKWLREQGIQPRIYAQVAGHEAIVSMVSLGFGVGLIPQIVIDNSPLKNKVRPFCYQPPLKPYEVGLCVLEKRLRSPIVAAFWRQPRLNEPARLAKQRLPQSHNP